MNTRLVGTRDWDPTGESFWGVMSKLCARNHMSWEEARSVLGALTDRSVTTEAGSNPDDISNVNIGQLRALTGWSDAQVYSGFSGFYKPYWMRGNSDTAIPLSRSIRICHDCANYGIHLAIHQFLDWTHCPVHGTVLRNNCPNCTEELGYSLLTSDFPQRALCSGCQWTLWGGDRINEPEKGASRLQFLSDYLAWQQRIQIFFTGDSRGGEWLGNPTRYDQLAHVNTLVEGPSCLPSCFVNARKMKMRKIAILFNDEFENHTLISTKEAEQGTLDFGESDELPVDRSFETTYLDRVRLTIRQKHQELKKRHPADNDHSGVREISSKHLIVQHGRYTTCWASAHWLWRRCFDDAWPRTEKWSRMKQHTSLLKTELGKRWSQAFAQYFSPDDLAIADTEAQINRLILSKKWTEAWLDNAYYGFAALSCHATDLQALNSDDLAAHLSDIGTLPLLGLIYGDKMDHMVCLCTVNEPNYFADLQSSGFTGNDEKLMSKFSRLQPLFNGVGLHPETKRRWKIDSSRVRAQLNRRKLR